MFNEKTLELLVSSFPKILEYGLKVSLPLAVIAFVLGVAVTLFCLWYRKTKHQKTGSSRTTEMEEHL